MKGAGEGRTGGDAGTLTARAAEESEKENRPRGEQLDRKQKAERAGPGLWGVGGKEHTGKERSWPTPRKG